MSRLLIVSNRLPITIDKNQDKLNYSPSAGGLATGLDSLENAMERLWFGWVGMAIEEDWEKAAIEKDLYKDNLIPVFLSQEDIELFYEGFSNKVIWPHFHYFTQYTTYEDSYWEAFQRVNELFAEVIIKQAIPGDTIWIHDYHLLLLPALIRKQLPDVSIGFFLHIPFPSYEVFRILPWRKALLTGVLGADVIGFHTYGYMRHFLSAVYRIIGFENNFGKLIVDGRAVNVDVFPMGIDYWKYATHEIILSGKDHSFQIGRLAKKHKLILSIDRLDYTKGIPQRILAFEQFLDEYPEYQGKVILFLIVVPSRENVDQYQELKEEVERLVGRINGAYGTFDWFPIRYHHRSLTFSELSALYRESHIGLITPLRDGMNLIAKEFVASKETNSKGVLILSEMTGASNEMTDALIINPQDSNAIVYALKQALEMNEGEQSWRLRKMQAQLKKYDVKYWANSFLKELTKLTDPTNNKKEVQLNKASVKELIDAYKQASKRLIVLDYDGTLMNFHVDPQAVMPDEELLILLSSLCLDDKNKVVINTGRDKTTINKWLGHLSMDFAAEHGVWIKKDDNWVQNPGLRSEWKKEVLPVLEQLVERTPGSFIEEKDFSLAWHYRRVDKNLGAKRVRESKDVLAYLIANLDLQILDGNKVVEVKNTGVSKGQATLEWLNLEDWDFILAIGDDHTDEDIFKVLSPNAYSVKVGEQPSIANYRIRTVEQVRELLGLLLGKEEV